MEPQTGPNVTMACNLTCTYVTNQQNHINKMCFIIHYYLPTCFHYILLLCICLLCKYNYNLLHLSPSVLLVSSMTEHIYN